MTTLAEKQDEWIEQIRAFSANLQVGDLCAVRNEFCAPTNRPYFIYRVTAIHPKQGVMSPTDREHVAPAHEIRFWRDSALVIGSVTHAYVQPVSVDVVRQNKQAVIEYWSRYGAEDDIARLSPTQQAEVMSFISTGIGVIELHKFPSSFVNDVTAKILMLPGEARAQLFDKIKEMRGGPHTD